jgi:hypothetical protein
MNDPLTAIPCAQLAPLMKLGFGADPSIFERPIVVPAQDEFTPLDQYRYFRSTATPTGPAAFVMNRWLFLVPSRLARPIVVPDELLP